MMFAAERRPANFPNTSHTFCAVVKITDSSDGTSSHEGLIYSWLPGQLGPWIHERRPEPGKNYGLEETLEWALRVVRAQVTAWQPLRVTANFYDLARLRVAFLNGGQLQYTLVDNPAFRPDQASNCIHAASDTLVPNFPMLLTGLRHGIRASQYTLDYFSKYGMISGPASQTEFDELRTYLNLTSYAIDFRDYTLVHQAIAVLDSSTHGPPPDQAPAAA